MSIDANGISKAVEGESTFDTDLEKDLFEPRPNAAQLPNQASERQKQLLVSVVQEHTKKVREKQGQQQQQQSQQKGYQPPRPQVDVLGSGMSSSSQGTYILIVFGTIFGLGALAVRKLQGNENASKDRSSKKEKKGKKG